MRSGLPPLTPRDTNAARLPDATPGTASRRATLPAGWEPPSASQRAAWAAEGASTTPVAPNGMPKMPNWELDATASRNSRRQTFDALPPPSAAVLAAGRAPSAPAPPAQQAPPASPWDAPRTVVAPMPGRGGAFAPSAPPSAPSAALPPLAPLSSAAAAPAGGASSAINASLPSVAPAAASAAPPWAAQLVSGTSAPAPPWAAQLAQAQPQQPAWAAGAPPAPPSAALLSPPPLSATPAPTARGSTRRLTFDAPAGGAHFPHAPGAAADAYAAAAALAAAQAAAAQAAAEAAGPPPGLLETRRGEEKLLLVAYEACVQTCVESALAPGVAAGGDATGTARLFLADRCAALQRGFGLQALLLQPAASRLNAAFAPHAPRASFDAQDAAPPAEAAPAQPAPLRVTVQMHSLSWERTLAGSAAKMLRMSRDAAADATEATSVWLEGGAGGEARAVPPAGGRAEFALAASGPGIASATVVVEALARDGRRGVARCELEVLGRTARAVPLRGPQGERLGAVSLSAVVAGGGAAVAPKPPPATPRPAGNAGAARKNGGGSAANGDEDEWRIPASESAVYDAALEAALLSLRFGRRRLQLRGDWAWLLGRLGAAHGVSETYAALRYLLHVLGAATPTADCLELVLTLFAPAFGRGEEGALGPAEARMLAAAREGVDRLVASTFEQYKLLCEALPAGVVADGPLPLGAPVPAPALPLAVRLFSLLHDPLAPEAQRLLGQHFRTAALRTYSRRAAAALHSEEDEGGDENADSNAGGRGRMHQESYASLARLVANMGEELRVDIVVHDAAVLPATFDLPALMAEEYSRELGDKLRNFLARSPPPRPAGSILDLLDATGDLHDKLAGWQLLGPATAPVEPVALFGRYIRAWIADSRAALVLRCRAWATAGGGKAAQRAPAAPGAERAASVAELYAVMQGVLSEYERVVSRWPLFAAELEDALAAAERTMLSAIDVAVAPALPAGFRASQAAAAATARANAAVKDAAAEADAERREREGPMPGCMALFGGVRKRVLAPAAQAEPPLTTAPALLNIAAAASTDILPAELAAALVALKAMEAQRSDVHARLKRWATGGGGAPAEQFGKLFLVVGQELRGKYMDYLKLAVSRVADGVRRAVSVRQLLQSLPAEADPALAFAPLLSAVREAVESVERACGRGRAFVALTRGVWDALAQQVMLFLLDDCKENSSWTQRAAAAAAAEALAQLFGTLLSGQEGGLGHDVREEDLRPPEHARRVADLQNLSLVSSFSMY